MPLPNPEFFPEAFKGPLNCLNFDFDEVFSLIFAYDFFLDWIYVTLNLFNPIANICFLPFFQMVLQILPIPEACRW